MIKVTLALPPNAGPEANPTTVVREDDPHTVIITVAFRIVGDPEGKVFSAPLAFNTLRLAA